MALLLDVFGFLSVVLRGLVLTAQSLAIGGVAFLVLLAHPLRTQLGASGAAVFERCRRLLLWSAIAFAALELVFVLLECLVLAGTVDISLAAAFGADFARFGMTAAAASVLAAALARRPLEGLRFAALPVLALVMLLAQAATSHAAAQLNGRAPLMLADLLHMAAAAAWIGGIPYLLLALGRASDGAAQARIGRRFSLIALGAVAVLIAAGLGMAVPYIGSLDAIYGTAYGVMVATKVLLLLGLLLLGGMNYLLVERVRRAPGTPVLRLKRFAEVEIGLGFTVLFAAASLTSQPPAVDLTTDRASLHEIAQRLTPRWPRFESPDHASLALSELQAQLDAAAAANAPRPQAFVPGEGVVPPRNAEDIAWSEYNHHWAGLFVLAAFLFIRSDPEVWPLGDIGFFVSFRDPEVVQHRIFVALIAAFALFEWRVRTGRLRRSGATLVFPLITALGGALLLTHSHALSNIKEQLLIEITHVPLALCGITAAWARWLELRLDEPGSRIAAWIWPIAFILVSFILLLYREA